MNSETMKRILAYQKNEITEHLLYTALAVAISAVVVIVSVFTFFMSVVKGLDYLKALAEVSMITCCVVALSFSLGVALKHVFG